MVRFWIVLLLIAFVSQSPCSAAERPPNIVLVVADDLGYGDLGCYGSKTNRTPNLDRLAKEGTRFTNFCVAQAVCTASRTALMSGCYPNRLGMAGALNHTSRVGIHPDEMLLPELLKARGYATAHFGKWHLGTRPKFYPTRNGFDRWLGLPYSNDNGPLHPSLKGLPALPLIENDNVIAENPDQGNFTKLFTEKSVAFIRENREQPFFLYVPHVMPHVPIFASERFRGKSKHGLYTDVIEELDWSIGELQRAVRDIDQDSNTLFLFLSDNGPFLSYGEHAGSAGTLREGKLTTFEGGVRVPFIARWPGKVPAGKVSNGFLTGLDLLPTLASIAGAKQPVKKIDGVNLSGLLLGKPDAPNRDNFVCYAGSELQAVRDGRWKLHFSHEYLTVAGEPGRNGKPSNVENIKPIAIEESGIRGIASRHGYRVEKIAKSLFDLVNDPGERTDVAAQHPDIVRVLEAEAAKIREELGDSLTKTVGKGLREPGRD